MILAGQHHSQSSSLARQLSTSAVLLYKTKHTDDFNPIIHQAPLLIYKIVVLDILNKKSIKYLKLENAYDCQQIIIGYFAWLQ